MVVRLRFDHNLTNNAGKRAIDHDWSGRLKNAISTRQTMEADEEKFRQYQLHVDQIKDEERKQSAYQSGTVFTHNFLLFHSLSHPQKNRKLIFQMLCRYRFWFNYSSQASNIRSFCCNGIF